MDDAYEGIINVTIIATGFSQSYEEQLFKPTGAAAAARRAPAPEPVVRYQ